MPFQQGSARTRQRTVLLVGIVVLVVALVLAVVLASLLTHREEEDDLKMLKWKNRGTTKNLQEVVLGRCYNYVTARYPELGDKDCLKIWDSLKHAFIYKNPCNITSEDYQPLMELANHAIPCNKSLFWSKTNDLVHRYTKSNQNFLTLEDTLLGYIADRVSWCGDPSAPG
ncbi:CD38 hydrolase, partial [Indicator maculatus]|nr:CD38 hydrolase [Indicator maculatus]